MTNNVAQILAAAGAQANDARQKATNPAHPPEVRQLWATLYVGDMIFQAMAFVVDLMEDEDL
jgi:hypothetical protein